MWLLIFRGTYAFAEQKSASDIFSENMMGIVHVEVGADPSSPNKQPSYGTGFIIGKDGYVLTAKHVLGSYINSSATPISVRLGSLDGRLVSADYVPFDIGIDVALLKLRSPIALGLTAYHSLERGDSAGLVNGVPLFIMGFNLTSNLSVASGVLASNLGGGTGGNLEWQIQSAGVVFGMSGAPVFGDNGKVVGIVTGGQPGTGIVVAYPEQLLEALAAIPGWKRAAAAKGEETQIAGHPSAVPGVDDIWRPLGATSGWEVGLVIVIEQYCEIETKPCQDISTLWLFENIDKGDQNLIEFGTNDFDAAPQYIELEAREMDADTVKQMVGRLGSVNKENADESSLTLKNIIDGFGSLSDNPAGKFIGRSKKVFKGDPKDKVEDLTQSMSRGDVSINGSDQFRVGPIQNPVRPHEWVAVTSHIRLFAGGSDDLVLPKREGAVSTIAFKPSRLGYLVVQVERPNLAVDTTAIRGVEVFPDGRATDCRDAGHTDHSVLCMFARLPPYTKIALTVPVKPIH